MSLLTVYLCTLSDNDCDNAEPLTAQNAWFQHVTAMKNFLKILLFKQISGEGFI